MMMGVIVMVVVPMTVSVVMFVRMRHWGFCTRYGMRRTTKGAGGYIMRSISWNIQWGKAADGRVDLRRTIYTLGSLGPAASTAATASGFQRRWPGAWSG